MPGPVNTLLIDGSFEELSDELAHYLDDRKRQGDDGTSLQADIAPLLEQGQKDEVLRRLVAASAVLNSAPEKGNFHRMGSPHMPRSQLTGSRIYCCVQSPSTPGPPVPSLWQISPQDMRKSLGANHLVSIQWHRSCPVRPHDPLQHSPRRQRTPLPRLPQHPPSHQGEFLLRFPEATAQKPRLVDRAVGHRRGGSA
jgi:hypothetical protein